MDSDSSLVQMARNFARGAFGDKTGPYGDSLFEHSERVAERLRSSAPDSSLAQATAWLHDVVEDTDVTLEKIRAQFGEAVAADVDLLTRRKEEVYADYITRIAEAGSTIAKAVKMADLHDHLEKGGISESLANRYVKALTFLQDHGLITEDPDSDCPSP